MEEKKWVSLGLFHPFLSGVMGPFLELDPGTHIVRSFQDFSTPKATSTAWFSESSLVDPGKSKFPKGCWLQSELNVDILLVND